jgi:lipoyl(octanoyl) transferase
VQDLKKMIELSSTNESVKRILGLQPWWIGFTEYSKALTLQENLSEDVRTLVKSGVILGLEHPPVVTLGRRGNQSDLISTENWQVIEVDRGGQATLHSPGQLVVYPILHLRNLKLSVREYVDLLEQSTVRMLKEYGITADKGCQAGVFTKTGKMAFVGVRVDRGVTRHGISINVSNDLQYFCKIKPCGFSNPSFDRMADYGVQAGLPEIFQAWVNYFFQGLSSSDQKLEYRALSSHERTREHLP